MFSKIIEIPLDIITKDYLKAVAQVGHYQASVWVFNQVVYQTVSALDFARNLWPNEYTYRN